MVVLIFDLMVLQFSVKNIGCFFMNVLEGDVLPQSHLCSVKPGSNHPQRSRQRLIQVDVPVQQLQMTIHETQKQQNEDPTMERPRWSQFMFTFSQAIMIQQIFLGVCGWVVRGVVLWLVDPSILSISVVASPKHYVCLPAGQNTISGLPAGGGQRVLGALVNGWGGSVMGPRAAVATMLLISISICVKMSECL